MTATHDIHYSTWLSHFRQHDTHRIISILCRAAQGGQGKYSSGCRVLLSLMFLKKLQECKWSINLIFPWTLNWLAGCPFHRYQKPGDSCMRIFWRMWQGLIIVQGPWGGRVQVYKNRTQQGSLIEGECSVRLNLLVLTSLNQLILKLKILSILCKISYHNEKINHTEPSLQSVFPGHNVTQHNKTHYNTQHNVTKNENIENFLTLF